jgi:hypothetical protein
MKKVEFKITVYKTYKGDLEATLESPFGNMDFHTNNVDSLIMSLKEELDEQKLSLKGFLK